MRRVIGDLHGAWVGQAYIFPSHAHDATGQVARVGAAVDHTAKPVKGGVGVGAAHRFVQGADLVVKGVAAFVKTAQLLPQTLQQPGIADLRQAARLRRGQHGFGGVDEFACVAVGIGDQTRPSGLVKHYALHSCLGSICGLNCQNLIENLA